MVERGWTDMGEARPVRPAGLSKTSTVMHRVAQALGGELFSQDLDEGLDFNAERRGFLTTKDWVDFGSPETITVTVVPGDTLNEEN